LHEAAFHVHTTIVELLIKAAADINAKDNDGMTPLHLAAYKGHREVAELLINAGANVNEKDNNGSTPLHEAADNGYTAVAELLINAGAEVNAKANYGSTPLHLAAQGGCTAVAELLINAGAQINAQDNNGKTPLHSAALCNKAAFFELLAILNTSSRVNRIAALYEVRSSKGEQLFSNDNFDRNLLRPILRYGDWNMNPINKEGKTPLDIAREKGRNEVVQILEGIVSTYQNQ
jgi:ankyrin repeat protein